MSFISAQISPKILSKVDRLFSNSTLDLVVELLQNARRAKATRVLITTTPLEGDAVKVSVEDDGTGIVDFSTLLRLGDSNWDEETAAKEDPAGMGFFSLLHSGVIVDSLGQSVEITPDVFRGIRAAEIVESEEVVDGTRLTFTRANGVNFTEKVQVVAPFAGITVILNGSEVQAKNFLEDALQVVEYKGLRLGVVRTRGYRECECNLNFYGRILNFELPMLPRVIPTQTDRDVEVSGLRVLVDVLDTGFLSLKLPDRTAVVENENYEELKEVVRKVLFEYLATLPEHVAPFRDYQMAHSLGIDLKEAAPYLSGFNASPWDSSSSSPCDGCITRPRLHRLSSEELEKGFLVFDAASFDTTLDMTLSQLPEAERPILLESNKVYSGYSWYEGLTAIMDVNLYVHETGEETSTELKYGDTLGSGLKIVDSMELHVSFSGPNGDRLTIYPISLAACHCDDADYHELEYSIYVTKDSEWVVKKTPHGSVDLVDLAEFVGFSPNDDCDSDSYDTQRDDFVAEVSESMLHVLDGQLAVFKKKLQNLLFSFDRHIAKQLGVAEIRLTLAEDAAYYWTYELKTKDGVEVSHSV